MRIVIFFSSFDNLDFFFFLSFLSSTILAVVVCGGYIVWMKQNKKTNDSKSRIDMDILHSWFTIQVMRFIHSFIHLPNKKNYFYTKLTLILTLTNWRKSFQLLIKNFSKLICLHIFCMWYVVKERQKLLSIFVWCVCMNILHYFDTKR